MSEDIRVSVTRAGVASPIASHLPMQLDKLSVAEAASYQGSDPHFTYRAITTMLPMNDPQLILFRDHMVDEVTNDAITGDPRTYLIVGEPQMHTVTGQWEWVCTRMRGKK